MIFIGQDCGRVSSGMPKGAQAMMQTMTEDMMEEMENGKEQD